MTKQTISFQSSTGQDIIAKIRQLGGTVTDVRRGIQSGNFGSASVQITPTRSYRSLQFNSPHRFKESELELIRKLKAKLC